MSESTVTSLGSGAALQGWPAGSSNYPSGIDGFIEQTSGQFAQDFNDITAALTAIESTLGTLPEGSSSNVGVALQDLQTAVSSLTTTVGTLSEQVAILTGSVHTLGAPVTLSDSTGDNNAFRISIPGGTMTVGSMFTFEIRGLVSWGVAGNFTLFMTIGGYKRAVATFPLGPSGTHVPWAFRGTFQIKTAGSSGTYVANADAYSAYIQMGTTGVTPLAIDTTATVDIAIGVACDHTVATSTTILSGQLVERL